MWIGKRLGSQPNRLLKKFASFVLGSSKSSTSPRGYASGFDSPVALLDGLFEQPAKIEFFLLLPSDKGNSQVILPCAHHSSLALVSVIAV